jgi:hypothetical protein
MLLGLLPSAVISAVESLLDWFEILEARNQEEKELERTARTGNSLRREYFVTLCSGLLVRRRRSVNFPGDPMVRTPERRVDSVSCLFASFPRQQFDILPPQFCWTFMGSVEHIPSSSHLTLVRLSSGRPFLP